jgi:nicotinamidase-related amidase
MKPAIVVVDMLKDNLREGSRHPVVQAAREIIPGIQTLLKEGRRRGYPILFANDSFLEGDFIFRGRMKIHSLRGTRGSEVLEDLGPEAGDMVLPKRRFSAFFKTDLDQTLRTLGADTIVLAGITVEVCVLMTAMDGLSHDFSVVILEDCTASQSKDIHRSCLDLYRDFNLYPLLRILTLEAFLKEVCS